jgi:protein tyrosine phosphatase (PTP) superfamily phosphohydrolase (DUF442 family)
VSGDWQPDFHWVTDRVAIGGCFPIERTRDLGEGLGISAIVDLRAEECDDAAALEAAGIELLHLPTTDMQPASHEHLEQGVKFVRDRTQCGRKVLIHCQHGIGRSALLALCVLVDAGWAPLDALVHLKNRRETVSPSRSQYEGWANWLMSRGLAAPDYHAFGCIAYRHLASG